MGPGSVCWVQVGYGGVWVGYGGVWVGYGRVMLSCR